MSSKKIIIRKKIAKPQIEKTTQNTIESQGPWVIEMGQWFRHYQGRLYTEDNRLVGNYVHDKQCPNCNKDQKCWFYLNLNSS